MDEIDIASKRAQDEFDHTIQEHLRSARPMAKGSPGDCELCGYWNGRLVGGACSPCRDKYGLE